MIIDCYAEKKYAILCNTINTPFDSAVVFFNDFETHDTIDDESLRRLSIAIVLYKQRVINNIIFCGGWRPSIHTSGSKLMATMAKKMGVERNHIYYETHSRDTVQNWKEAEKIIVVKNFKKIILLSSPFHLMRIKKIVTIHDDIDVTYGSYSKRSIIPPKGYFDNFCDYNYNMTSIISYYLLPTGLYQYIVTNLRN
jgi:vancomycin permeability regulator SanA